MQVNGRVADISSKPAYSKRQWQPDWLGQPAFFIWVAGYRKKGGKKLQPLGIELTDSTTIFDNRLNH